MNDTGVILIPASEVKLDQDHGPLKVLTMSATSFTDQIRRGSQVRYKRKLYEVVGKRKPKEMTVAIVSLSLRPVEQKKGEVR